eukprot:COSAG01_NODE_672_length_14331_cov_88.368092_2_plen_46_part_00
MAVRGSGSDAARTGLTLHADLRIQNPLIQIYFIMGEKHACCAGAE